jgi:hypothetical protein
VICIPITAATTEAAIALMHEAAPLADLIELRIDGMEECDLPRLLQGGRGRSS